MYPFHPPIRCHISGTIIRLILRTADEHRLTQINLDKSVQSASISVNLRFKAPEPQMNADNPCNLRFKDSDPQMNTD